MLSPTKESSVRRNVGHLRKTCSSKHSNGGSGTLPRADLDCIDLISSSDSDDDEIENAGADRSSRKIALAPRSGSE